MNDEKRQSVKVGDYIEFSMTGNASQKILTLVTALHRFSTFQELYAELPKEKLGYSANEVPDQNHMDAFYSKDEQAVLAFYFLGMLVLQAGELSRIFEI